MGREVRPSEVRPSVTVFVVLVVIAAALTSALLPSAGLADSPFVLLALVALAGFVGSRAVRIPTLRVELTAADAFTFCGMLAVGPMAAPIVALVGIVGSVVGNKRRPALRCVLLNIGGVTLSAAGAAWVHLALTRVEGLGEAASSVAALAAAFSFAAINATLVAVAMRIERGAPLLATWSGFGFWAIGSAVGSLLLALGLIPLLGSLGIGALVVGLFGTALVDASIKAFRDRARDSATLAPS